MKLSELLDYLESIAPPAFQESYDNSGLIVGRRDMDVRAALVTLDCTEAVVEEAIRLDANLIIAHHPIVFSGLKKFNGKNYVERTVMNAIRHDIAIYAAHTNLDNIEGGVNAEIARRIGLQDTRILSPKSGLLRKLVTFCPHAQADAVRDALFAAGAGTIGDYDECSFNLEGNGTFRGDENTDPFIGEKGKRNTVGETRIEVIYPAYREGKILTALLQAHPYEEAAYDLHPLQNSWKQVGSGMIGKLPEPLPVMDFLRKLKTDMQAPVIRYTPVEGKMVQTIAVCGGAGSFLLPEALAARADVFVTADYKYHQFFDAEGRLVIADIGHYESEQFTKDLLMGLVREKFPTFAIRLSEIQTNPITYLF